MWDYRRVSYISFYRADESKPPVFRSVCPPINFTSCHVLCLESMVGPQLQNEKKKKLEAVQSENLQRASRSSQKTLFFVKKTNIWASADDYQR